MSGPARDLPRPGGLEHGLLGEPGARGPGAAAMARALWPRRRLVAGCVLAGAALAFAIALVLPPVYVASVSVLEAPRATSSSALDQIASQAEMIGLKPGPGASGVLTYPDILRSRRLLAGLLELPVAGTDGRARPYIDRVGRRGRGPARVELAVRALRKRLDVALDRRTNVLHVSVRDRDPVIAAAVANAACAALQGILVHDMTTQAGANRRFIERRLDEVRGELVRAEAALRAFREINARFDGSPRLLLEQARLARELRTREEMVIVLTRQHEMARIDENRDVPVLNVLDPAVPPAFRSSPRRGALTAGGALLGLALGVALAWPRAGRAEAGLAEAA